jgi:hypothetical protein
MLNFDNFNNERRLQIRVSEKTSWLRYKRNFSIFQKYRYFTRRNRYLIQKDVIEPVPQQDVKIAATTDTIFVKT